MVIATHIIKIRGTLDKNIWTDENNTKEYVKDKIRNDIDPSFHTDLELFKIDGDEIDVWVYIHAFPSEVTMEICEKWIKDHIKEEGISVDRFEFEKIFDLTEKSNIFTILIP